MHLQLLRVRVQLSALYSLQYLLSQPPVTFHLFPDNAFKVALVEQKYLNKIVDALIRRTMKQNGEILDLVPVIKTRQAIRMASHTLHNTIASLNAYVLSYLSTYKCLTKSTLTLCLSTGKFLSQDFLFNNYDVDIQIV